MNKKWNDPDLSIHMVTDNIGEGISGNDATIPGDWGDLTPDI